MPFAEVLAKAKNLQKPPEIQGFGAKIPVFPVFGNGF